MANYIFKNINAGLEIKAPSISVNGLRTNVNDKTCEIDILISLVNPQAKAVKFVVTLSGFSYTGNEPLKDEIEAWVATELIKYEV